MLLVASAAFAIGAAACDTGDGRELAAPPPGVTAPPLVEATTATTAGAVNPPVGSSDSGSLVLSSGAFGEGGAIPVRFTCAGEDLSPPLTWSGVPTGTVELAITVVDVTTSEQFVHWVVTGIDPTVLGFAEGGVPEGAVEARGSASVFGWSGPCPPPGETHSYVFSLHALTAASGVAAGTAGPEAIQQLAAVDGIVATLSGTFTGG